MYQLKENSSLYNSFGARGYWEMFAYKFGTKPLFLFLSKLLPKLKSKCLSLHLRNYQNQVYFRHNTSDTKVLYQVFFEQQYACISNLELPKLIVDCGANVGYASLYFLNKYPHTHIIAVEPDLENFKICEKNLEFYQERISLIHSGIWSHSTGLAISKGDFGDCREWAIQVKEVDDDRKADIYAIDIYSLLENSRFTSIDLLKMDVEGAETTIFSRNYDKWLSKVKNIAIELHGEECRKKFFQALSAYKYELSEFGELTICKNIRKK